MAKKRSCRRTALEDEQHERAVRIRKMTDRQICDYIDNIVETSEAEVSKANKVKSVSEFLSLLVDGQVKGIGMVTTKKLEKVAQQHGFI